MKRLILFSIAYLMLVPKGYSQLVASNTIANNTQQHLTSNKSQKTKAANYNSLGYNHSLNQKDIMVGGTSTVYRKFGTFINFKVGIQNFMMPTKGEKGEYYKENVIANNWTITGRTEKSVAFMVGGGFAVAITKKIPLYLGAGITRYREFFEYLDPNDQNKPKWNVDLSKRGVELNYTAGVFIPLFSRVVLNVGYDHNPQSVFVGLAISGRFNFEDADEWWWQ